MANGDLGTLFFKLGIKAGDVQGIDELMRRLQEPKAELSALEKYAKNKIEALSRTNAQYVRELNKIEKAQGKLDFKEYIASLTRESDGLSQTTQWLRQKAAALNAVNAAQSKANRQNSFMSALNNLTAPKAADNADYWRRQERLAEVNAKANTEMGKQSRLLGQLKNAAVSYVSIWTGAQFIQSLVRISGEFEMARVSLRAMLNDLNAADRIFSQTKALAVESPYQFMDLMNFSKQLAAFSTPVDELFETTKMLSDISAGLGVDMGRIVLAYSQIRSAQVLKGTELRQLTEAGVPILEDLSRMFSQMEGQAVTIGDVFERISARQVPFEMVEQAFKDMTSEGGKFYRMQEIQSETLRGQVSNIADAWQIALYELGSSQDSFLKGGVAAIRMLIDNFDDVVNVIGRLVAAYGTYMATSLLVSASTGRVAAGMGLLGKAMRSLGNIWKTNPVGLVISGLVALGLTINRIVKNAHELENSLQEAAEVNFSGAEESVYSLNKLIRQLTDAEKGSKAYSDAVMSLNNRYGEYLPHLLSEADALSEITRNYESVTEAIYAKAQAQSYEAQMNRISEEYDADMMEALMNMRTYLVEHMGFTNGEAYDIVESFKAQVESMLKQGMRYDSSWFAGDANTPFNNIIGNVVKAYAGGDRIITEMVRRSARQYMMNASDRFDATLLAGDISDSMFGVYDTADERRRAEEIETIYKSAIDEIDNTALTSSERDRQIKDAQADRLRSLIALYRELGNESKASSYENQLSALLNSDIDGWIKKARTIKDQFDRLSFSPNNKGYFEHLEDWANAYDNATERLGKAGEGNLSDSVIQGYKDEIYWLNELSKSLGFGEGFELYRDRKTVKADNTELDMIKDWISRLKELKGVYDEFKALEVRDTRMSGIFSDIFGEFGRQGISSGALGRLREYDFGGAIEVYVDMLRNGNEEMRKAAEEIDNETALDKAESRVKELREAVRINEEIGKIYEELAGVLAVSGTGVEHDFSKIVSDLKRQQNDLRTERDNSLESAGKKFSIDENAAEYERAMDAINALFEERSSNLERNAEEKVRDLASRFVDEQIKANRLSLTDYADKTIKQIRDQLDVLWDIYGQVQSQLVDAQLSSGASLSLGEDVDSTVLAKIQMLKEALDELGILIDNQEDEIDKKLLENVRAAASGVASLGGEIASLGEVTGNSGLEAFGQALQGIGNIAANLVSALSSGNWLGFGFSVISMIFSGITNSIREAKEEQEALNEAAREYQRILNDTRRERYDTIFGTDDWGLMMENIRIASEMAGKIRGLKVLQNELKFTDSGWFRNGAIWSSETWWESIPDYFKKKGWNLYNEDGSLNTEMLRQFLELEGDNLSDAAKKDIEDAINYGEELEEAMEAVVSNLQSMFGDLAGNIASDMVDAFIETGNAAIDFQDTMTDVAKTIATQILQSFIMDAVLGDFEQQIKDIVGSDMSLADMGSSLIDMFENAIGTLEEASPEIQALLEALLGDYVGMGSGGENLAEGIKSITEDQANLLASYINAIRAYVAQITDVAIQNGEYMRTINETINIGLSVLKEINGNTAVIRDNTNQMGRLMRSLTTSGSGTAINARML